MRKIAVIMVTSNGVGAGHLIRTAAIAKSFSSRVRPIIFSMANSALEVSKSLGIECEFVPGRDKGWMQRRRWDRYLRDRLIALIDETNAKVVTFDGVVPYPGLIAMKFRRPQVTLVWVRRGMWKTKPQGLALSLQSKLMDYVIEPGDIASSYDSGPTKNRAEAEVTSPVTLFQKNKLVSKKIARQILKLPPQKLIFLVQLGVGDSDINQKVRAVLSALSKIRNVLVVMTRVPKDIDGKSIVPKNLDIQIIRYFPLAEVLSAFDGVICASGYNSVHEVIPARIPTLFIPNTRGTDDQEARARWCADLDLALFATGEDEIDLVQKINQLSKIEVRSKLSSNCRKVDKLTGAKEIAEIVESFMNERINSLVLKRIRYQRLLAQSAFERGMASFLRRNANYVLRFAALILRFFFPYKFPKNESDLPPIEFHSNIDSAANTFRNGGRLEHVIMGASTSYIESRFEIATRAYQASIHNFDVQIVSGNSGFISLNSSNRSA